MSDTGSLRPILIQTGQLSGIIRNAGYSINPLSPFQRLPAPAGVLTPESAALGQDRDFMSMVEIACSPVSVVNSRIGGSAVPFEEMHLCWKRVSGSRVISVLKTAEDEVSLQTWPDSGAFVEWWCGNFACKSDTVVANYMPPMLSLEGLMTLLHCIDAYRRATFRSMLNFTPYDMPTLTPAEFTESAAMAIKSRDIRWLLPSFAVLVPGLAEYNLGGMPDLSREAWSRNFLKTVTHRDTGEERIGFGEAGSSMGMEFYRTWLMGAGFELKTIRPEGIVTAARVFLAPTGLTNHLIALEAQPDGSCTANHQPYHYEQLTGVMKQMFAGIMTV